MGVIQIGHHFPVYRAQVCAGHAHSTNCAIQSSLGIFLSHCCVSGAEKRPQNVSVFLTQQESPGEVSPFQPDLSPSFHNQATWKFLIAGWLLLLLSPPCQKACPRPYYSIPQDPLDSMLIELWGHYRCRQCLHPRLSSGSVISTQPISPSTFRSGPSHPPSSFLQLQK